MNGHVFMVMSSNLKNRQGFKQYAFKLHEKAVYMFKT